MSYLKEKLEIEFKAAKMEVAQRVVQVVEGREISENDMQYFEFIQTVPDSPNFPADTQIVETIVYKHQIICKLSAASNGQITIYPYFEL